MENQNALKTGTTTVGIMTSEGLVVAADRQATMGYLVADKEILKLAKLSPHIALTIAGSVGDAQVLIRLLRAKANSYNIAQNTEIETDRLANYLASLLNSNKHYPYVTVMLMAGYVSKPVLYSIDYLGGLSSVSTFASWGSGAPVAYGVLEDLFRSELTLDEGVHIAIKAVRAARERDAMSGGTGIDVYKVTKDGIKVVEESVVADICAKYSKRTLRP